MKWTHIAQYALMGSAAVAQQSSSSSSSSGASASATTTWTSVPTGTAVPGNYSGMYRPQVHFSPPRGFMNDPNGLHRDANGTWHLYYQYNPTAVVAGNQHWGHATSPDLYHWTNQPIAIFPPNSTTGIFSGSAVIDVNNTSGFFPNQTNGVVAIYTLNTPTLQVQEIAYSTDGGYTFTPYAGNPVINVNSNQFRDPKVVWYEDHWVMAVSHATNYTIAIYTSPNLTNWTYASNVSHKGLLGLQYECPNLVTVPMNGSDQVGWALAISINPGAPLGGSITQYFPGDFNGTHFTPYDGATRLTDWGKDNYAGQWFYGLSESQSVMLGWASNWQYTNVVPTANEGWRSSMSLPRSNALVDLGEAGWVMTSSPYDMTPIINGSIFSNSSFGNASQSVDFSNVTSGAIYFSMEVDIPANATLSDDSGMNFSFSSSDGSQTLKGGYYFGGNTANTGWIDRSEATAFQIPVFTDKFSIAPTVGVSKIEGVFDRSLFEMFINNGTYAGTFDVYATEMLTMFEISTTGIPDGSEVSVDVWGLNSVWGQYE